MHPHRPIWSLVGALVCVAAVAACAPAATVSAPTAQPSPTPTASETPTATPRPAPTATPTILPTPTYASEARLISPATLGQLRVRLGIDEPGKGDIFEIDTCQDIACWLPSRIGAAAFSPDSTLLAVGVCLGDPTENVTNPRHYRFKCKAGSEVRLYDTASGELVQALPVHDFPLALAFHPDGSVLAVGLSQRDIVLFDLASGEAFRTLQHSSKRDGVTWLAFTPDGARLLSLGDERVQVWDWQTPLLKATLERTSTAALSPDGAVLATLYFADQGFWRIRNYRMQDLPGFSELRMEQDQPGGLSFSPDTGWLNVISSSRVEMWDIATKELVDLVEAGDSSIPAAFRWSRTFTPDGHLVIFPQADDTGEPVCGFGLWRPGEKGITLSRYSEDDCYGEDSPLNFLLEPPALVVSPDGQWLAGRWRDGRLLVWGVDPAAEPVPTECLGTCGP